MKPKKIIAKEIIATMESLRDEGQRQVLMRFFKTGPGEYGEGDEFLGLKVPQTREVAKAASDTLLCEIPELLMSEWHEVRLCGLLIMVSQFEKLSTKRLLHDEEAISKRDEIVSLYLKYAERANNWDLVDLSAPKILGHWLLLPTRLRISSFCRHQAQGLKCSGGQAVGYKDYGARCTGAEQQPLASAHEHRLHVEDLAAGRPFVVPALC